MDATVSELVISFLLVVGGVFTLLGSIGFVRFPDVFTRLHGPTKATTLGIGALVVASVVHAAVSHEDQVWRALAIPLFLIMTAPITASLLAKVGRADARRDAGTQPDKGK